MERFQQQADTRVVRAGHGRSAEEVKLALTIRRDDAIGHGRVDVYAGTHDVRDDGIEGIVGTTGAEAGGVVAVRRIHGPRGFGDGGHVAGTAGQPRFQHLGVGVANVRCRQKVRVGVRGFTIAGRVGQHETAGAAGQDVRALVHAGDGAAVADHDFTTPRSGRERVEALLRIGVAVVIVSGVHNHLRPIAGGDGAANHVGGRIRAAAHVDDAGFIGAGLRRRGDAGEPGGAVRGRGRTGAAVAGRSGHKHARRRRCEESLFRGVAPGQRAAADGEVDGVDQAWINAVQFHDLIDSTENGRTWTTINANVHGHDVRVRGHALHLRLYDDSGRF